MVEVTNLVVCEGDETGQELLDEALRVLDQRVRGVSIERQRFDLSLDNRRRTHNAVVHETGEAMRDAGLGLKAATTTPEGAGDVGSPNRILREEVGGSVIVRTGRRLPGVALLGPVVHPIAVVRMAIGDAYGAEKSRAGPSGEAMHRPVGPSGPLGRAVAPSPTTHSGPPLRRWERSTTARSGPFRRSTKRC